MARVTVILVRHAQPEVMAERDPRHWALSRAGQLAATRLGARLPSVGSWVSSTETKASETLRCATGGTVEIAQDSGFDEVRRDEPFDDGYLARRMAWVNGNLDARHTGWEAPQDAAARFEDAVTRHNRSDRPLIIGTHGMVMTAWLMHCRRLPGSQDAGQFWRALALPDLVQVDD